MTKILCFLLLCLQFHCTEQCHCDSEAVQHVDVYVESWSQHAVTLLIMLITMCNRLSTGWKVRGLHPGEGRELSHLSRPALGPTQPPVQCVPGLSRG
jgi:hypothetical protein